MILVLFSGFSVSSQLLIQNRAARSISFYYRDRSVEMGRKSLVTDTDFLLNSKFN